MTRESLCFLTMAESQYPKRMAFLYLDEIADLILGELVREFGNNVSISYVDAVASRWCTFEIRMRIHYIPMKPCCKMLHWANTPTVVIISGHFLLCRSPKTNKIRGINSGGQKWIKPLDHSVLYITIR